MSDDNNSSPSTQFLAAWTTDSHCSYHGDSFNFILGLTHDGHVLFETSSFALHRGKVTGLVGTNGAGKSSLASVLASKQLPGFPSHLTVTYLGDSQAVGGEEETTMNMTPQDYLHHCMNQRLVTVEQEIERFEAQLEQDPADSEQVVERLSELYDHAESMKETAEREIQSILVEDLGFCSSLLQKKLRQLSSGWRYKCHLVAALLNHADLLIVDEPSFLDVKSTDWLVDRMNKVAKQEHAMVVLISHKEALLDKLCNDLLYINAANKTLAQYHVGSGSEGGGYSAFREIHAAQVESSRRAVHAADKKVSGADQTLQHIQSKLKRNEKNLKQTTTQNADQRFIKGRSKESKQKGDRAATSKLKHLKKQQADIQESLQQQTVTDRVKPIRIQGSREAAGTLAVLEDVAIAYNDEATTSEKETDPKDYVFENVELRLEPSDRILLAGANGCGKSTLIQVLLGELEPTQGSCRTNVSRQSCLYFPQTALHDLVRDYGSKSVVDFFSEAMSTAEGGESWTATQIRQHLGDFGLTRDTVLRPIRALSAGQRVRLWLAQKSAVAAMATSNDSSAGLSLLVLDEISENVDVETRNSLIQLINRNGHDGGAGGALSYEGGRDYGKKTKKDRSDGGWAGAVIVVSHDPDFCREYQPTQIWNLHRYGIRLEFSNDS